MRWLLSGCLSHCPLFAVQLLSAYISCRCSIVWSWSSFTCLCRSSKWSLSGFTGLCRSSMWSLSGFTGLCRSSMWSLSGFTGLCRSSAWLFCGSTGFCCINMWLCRSFTGFSCCGGRLPCSCAGCCGLMNRWKLCGTWFGSGFCKMRPVSRIRRSTWFSCSCSYNCKMWPFSGIYRNMRPFRGDWPQSMIF
ncbi:hypothetical protein B566_EDAN001429, partial [Ephemera danica]